MGLRVSRFRKPGDLAAVALSVPAGPRFERTDNNGISHFLEHMLFHGCERWPDRFEFFEAFEQYGTEVNAFTQRDSVTLYACGPSSELQLLLDVIGGMATSPQFDQAAVDHERKVVTEEILESCIQDGSSIDLDQLSRQHLWAESPLGLPVTGTVESIQSFDAQDLHDWHVARFTDVGRLAIVAPDPEVEHGIILPRGHTKVRPVPKPWVDGPLRLRHIGDASVDMQLTWAVEPASAAYFSLGVGLACGFTSKLRGRLVERHGLCYSVGADYDDYGDAAAFDVTFTCAPNNLFEVIHEVFDTLGETFTESDAARVAANRRYLNANIQSSPETLALDAVTGINYVTDVPADVLTAAMSTLTPENAVVTATGPLRRKHARSLEDIFGKVRDSTEWHD